MFFPAIKKYGIGEAGNARRAFMDQVRSGLQDQEESEGSCNVKIK